MYDLLSNEVQLTWAPPLAATEEIRTITDSTEDLNASSTSLL